MWSTFVRQAEFGRYGTQPNRALTSADKTRALHYRSHLVGLIDGRNGFERCRPEDMPDVFLDRCGEIDTREGVPLVAQAVGTTIGKYFGRVTPDPYGGAGGGLVVSGFFIRRITSQTIMGRLEREAKEADSFASTRPLVDTRERWIITMFEARTKPQGEATFSPSRRLERGSTGRLPDTLTMAIGGLPLGPIYMSTVSDSEARNDGQYRDALSHFDRIFREWKPFVYLEDAISGACERDACEEYQVVKSHGRYFLVDKYGQALGDPSDTHEGARQQIDGVTLYSTTDDPELYITPTLAGRVSFAPWWRGDPGEAHEGVDLMLPDGSEVNLSQPGGPNHGHLTVGKGPNFWVES